jgi:hypothetical protein
MNWADFELFRVVTSREMSVNWLHDDAEIYIASGNGQLRMKPIFEQHIRDARNYTWSPEVCKHFPFLGTDYILSTTTNGIIE